MLIRSAELYELTLPLEEPFIISGGEMRERKSLIVVLADDEGHTGYGESPPFELPFYSEETLHSAQDLLQRVLLPRVVGKTFDCPETLDAALRAGIRGNPFARAGVETAGWDLWAARHGTGLARVLAERLGATPVSQVPCGVALGIPRDRQVSTLSRWIERALQAGYRRVKIKVAPGWDRVAVQAARDAMAGVDLPLTVDANGAYQWPLHESDLRGLDEAGLLYIEQPLAPDELIGHARLAQTLRTPICVDESLRDVTAARQLLELDGPAVWNVKVHRIGGLTELGHLWRLAARHHVRLWAGTMPESGLGSQAALAAASLPNFVYPSDLEPSARWFGAGKDVVELTMDRHGHMAVPDQPLSFLLDHDRFRTVARRLPLFGQ